MTQLLTSMAPGRVTQDSSGPVHPTPRTIYCTGSPYDIGFSHGKHAEKEIRHNIAIYTAYYRLRKVDWPEACSKAATLYEPALRQTYPEILEEMQGISDGAGHDITMVDILALNVRSEILLTSYADGCSAIAQLRPDGQMFLAQNWDWIAQLHDGIVMLDIKPAGSDLSMHFLSEAGIVGKIGMNTAGVGIVLNAIRARCTDATKFPVHIAMRRVLQYAHTFDEAVDIIGKFGLASSVNFMIADSAGHFGDVECSPLGNTVIEPSLSPMGKIVVHTNHMCTAISGKIRETPAKHSFARLARLRELTITQEISGVAASFESLRARLSDSQGYPFSICRGGPAGDGPEALELRPTVVSAMMELTQKKGNFVIGRPSEKGPVVEFSL